MARHSRAGFWDERQHNFVALYELDPGGSLEFASDDQTQVVYLVDGEHAKFTHVIAGETTQYRADRHAGLYLEPHEKGAIEATEAPLKLLHIMVPKHTAKPVASASPTGYWFDESKLRSLVDAKGLRERTFWVNHETGLSDSWDLQLGRMQYAPYGHSPRHVHHPSPTSDTVPEHFYLIDRGVGRVEFDGGSLPVAPYNLILIPSGDWHRLVASKTGLDYIEFQAPFDFVTTMDDDPLGKNWYIKGTDDGTGNPKLWVQS